MNNNIEHALSPATMIEAFEMMLNSSSSARFLRDILGVAAAQANVPIFEKVLRLAGPSTHRGMRSADKSWTLLAEAVSGGDDDIVAAVIATGKNERARNKLVNEVSGKMPMKTTALLLAVQSGATGIGKRLLDAGADPGLTAGPDSDTTPIHEAAERGCLSFLQGLLVRVAGDQTEKERVLNLTTNKGTTALHLASYRGYAEIAQYLVRAGANKDARNDDGATPLYRAAMMGNVEVVKMLLELEADRLLRPKWPQFRHPTEGMAQLEEMGSASILGQAVYLGNLEMVQMLFLHGCDLNESTLDTLSTPLHFAVCSSADNSDVIRFLLANGANVDATLVEGYTPLHLVANLSETTARKKISALVDARANVDSLLSGSSETPLHLACRANNSWAVDALVAAGANPNLENVDGMTAADVVGKWGGDAHQGELIKNALRAATARRRCLQDAQCNPTNLPKRQKA